MSITLNISRQAKGNNPARELIINHIIESYKEAGINERRKIYVLTPKQDTYQVERELIEKTGEGGLLGIQITDYESLIKDIVKDSRPKTQVVDIHGQLMVVQKSLLDVRDDLKIYRSSINEPGFKNAVIEEIHLLKSAQLNPALIEEQLPSIEDNLLQNKMKDLGLILNSYNKNMGEDQFDEVDLFGLSLELIETSPFLENAQIFVLDENILPFELLEFLIRAEKKAKRVEVTITTDLDPLAKDMSAFIVPNQIIKTLRKLAQEQNCRIDINELSVKNENSSLNSLAGELFSYNPEYFPGRSDVKVYQGGSPWDEVKQVAQRILLDNLKGTPFSAVAVASNDPEKYESIIRRVFTQYGVPYYIDENHKVIDNHFIQAVLAALDTVNGNFDRSDVLSYVKSEFSGLNPDEASLLENYAIEAGIRPFEWKKPFKRVPRAWRLEKDILEPDDDVVRIQQKVLNNLKPFLSIGRKKLKVNEYIDLIEKFLIKSKLENRLDELAEIVSRQGEQELSSRYRQIWNILQEILEQMRVTLGEVVMSFGDFISILKSGLTSHEVGTIPEDNEAVIISSVSRTRLPDIKNLYFIGLNEELLPKKQENDSLLNDYDREQIKNIFELPETLVTSNEFVHHLEENRFYTLITKAREKVFFTYHMYSNSGEEAFPSRYVDVLRTIYGDKIYERKTKVFELLTPKRANVILENFVNDKNYDTIKKILEEWFEDHKKEDEANIIETLPVKPQDWLSEVSARELYQIVNDRNRVSISRLENFASCPFKYFIDYGIRLRDREEYEVRSMDTGNIIHEIFDRFLERLVKESNHEKEKFHNALNHYLHNPDSFNKIFEEVFDSILNELEAAERYKLTAASRFLILKLKRLCITSLKIILNQLSQSDYIPAEFEQYFWDRRDDGIIIEGRIDRVDVKESEEGKKIRVVDYKTGYRSVDYVDLLYGTSLQLAVYLTEALKKTKGPVDPKGAYYFITRQAVPHYSSDVRKQIYNSYKMNGINISESPEEADLVKSVSKTSPGSLNGSEMEQLLGYSSNLVKSLADSLVEGDIHINPIFMEGKEKSCLYCNYKDICKFSVNNPEYTYENINKIDKETFFEAINKDKNDE